MHLLQRIEVWTLEDRWSVAVAEVEHPGMKQFTPASTGAFVPIPLPWDPLPSPRYDDPLEGSAILEHLSTADTAAGANQASKPSESSVACASTPRMRRSGWVQDKPCG